MSKTKTTKTTEPVKLDANTRAAVRAVAQAFKAVDKASAKTGEALGKLADAVADWMREHPKATAAYKKAYRAAIGAELEKLYDKASSIRGRLTQVFRAAELAVEHGSRAEAAKVVNAPGDGVDALYRASRKPSTSGTSTSKGKSAPTRGTPGLSLPAATLEALTANDVARLTMLAKGLATVDARRIAEAIAGIVANLDDKARATVKQAVEAAC